LARRLADGNQLDQDMGILYLQRLTTVGFVSDHLFHFQVKDPVSRYGYRLCGRVFIQCPIHYFYFRLSEHQLGCDRRPRTISIDPLSGHCSNALLLVHRWQNLPSKCAILGVNLYHSRHRVFRNRNSAAAEYELVRCIRQFVSRTSWNYGRWDHSSRSCAYHCSSCIFAR